MSDNSHENRTPQRRRTTQTHAPIYFIPPPRYIPPAQDETDVSEPSAEAVEES